MVHFHNSLIKFYQWLLPPTCIVCQRLSDQQQDICLPCLNSLPILPQTCIKCANLLPNKSPLCGQCLEQTPPFDATFALWSYQFPITHLITQLKFHECLVHAQVFGEIMAKTISSKWYFNKPLPDLIIPVPLHPKRLQERGYNQVLEIIRPVVKKLNFAVDFQSCIRTKATLPQTIIPAEDRLKNVQDAFAMNRDLSGLHIAVMDDVITTGSTITALCKEIRRAGATRIDVWCVAKTL